MSSKGNLLTDATFRRWETAIEFVYRYMSVISGIQPQRRWPLASDSSVALSTWYKLVPYEQPSAGTVTLAFQGNNIVLPFNATQAIADACFRAALDEQTAKSLSFTADASANALNLAQTITTGTAVNLYTTGTLPTPLQTGTVYYINATGGNLTLRLSPVSGGPINLTDTGTGTHTIAIGSVRYEFTADDSTDRITLESISTDLSGQVCRLAGDDLPEPLTSGKDYYIVNQSGMTIRLSETEGGSPIDLTDAGSGTRTLTIDGLNLSLSCNGRIYNSVLTIQIFGQGVSHPGDLQIVTVDNVDHSGGWYLDYSVGA